MTHLFPRWLIQCLLLGLLLLQGGLGVAASLQTEPVVLTASTQKMPVGTRLEYRIDAGNHQSLDTAMAWTDWQANLSGNAPNFYFSHNTVWLRFAFTTRDVPENWVLDVANPQLDRVDLYLFEKNAGQSQPTLIQQFVDGDTLDASQRPPSERTLNFSLKLKADTGYVVYLSTHSNTTLLLPVTLWQERAFLRSELHIHTLLTVSFGCLAGLMLYNLVLGFFTRDASYFFYSHYVLAVIFFQLALTGVGTQLFWSDVFWLRQKNLPLSMGYSVFAAALFVIKFLNLHVKCTRSYRTLLVMGIITLGMSASAVVLPEQITVPTLQVTTFIACLTALYIGAYQARAGNRAAKVFIWAWLPLIAGTCTTVIYYRGFLPRTLFTEQSQLFGAVLEMILLSLGLARRISDLRRAKYEASIARRHAEQDAEDARQGSQAKSDFLAKMSHEIRTPMNGVLGISELLSHTQLDETQKHYVRTIYNSGEALVKIINDILDFSKIEAKKLDVENIRFNLKDVLTECISILKPRLKGPEVNLQLSLEFDDPMWLMGDPTRLRQIILNLAGNAIKFTSQGSVTVKVSRLPARDAGVLLHFSVIDTGIGLTEEQISQLFKPFCQADTSTARKYGGTGLGLAICKELAHLMGGDIGVESTPGAGSNFWFTIHCDIASPEESPAHKSAPVLGRLPKGLKVLVAEDNKVNQMVLSGLLEKLEVHAQIVENGEEAVRIACQQHETLDLVLMDCEMPVMNGFESTSILRGEEVNHGWPTLPVIALTAHAQEEASAQCLGCGMDDVLTKPVNLQRLEATIFEVLTRYGRTGVNTLNKVS